MARLLWSLGTLLVLIGVLAHLFGWDALLWIPEAVLDALRADPRTYGVILAGAVLMLVARIISRRG
ncbi:MAG: hypothetical protein AVDCRST_MAG27-2966 [uncultured Craurococcus sp.]|uniref:Uncharacterized protein n=1 Tax=uncultured Craurococcus sp. TaxID=1135998 RepID=A0A6J4J2D3_9PROT|nr:MAG: hypothetical protein AVDCRST_MAG27-2966 [uncultured Craurococcus sp.]